jgi:hypothetical protein
MTISEPTKKRLSLAILPLMTALAIISSAIMFGVYLGRFDVGHAGVPLISYAVCLPLEIFLLLVGIPLLIMLNRKWRSFISKNIIYTINALWFIAITTNLASILRML